VPAASIQSLVVVSAPSLDTLPVGTVVGGRYRIERALGSGGFGAVFAATDQNTRTTVALKVLDTRALEGIGGDERFRREADLARRVQHPGLVRVLDEGRDGNGLPFIAFELLEGRSLADEITRWGALPPKRVAAIAGEILEALEAAHRAGIVHRDLKPSNVFLLQGNDQVKVLDFGIAKSTNPHTVAGLTRDGIALGTPLYMAPEQLMGQPSASSDLFALGVVMLEMLLGRPPYSDAVSAMEVVRDRLGQQPLPIPNDLQHTPLGAIIAQATQGKPEQRFASARQMADALRAALPSMPDNVVSAPVHAEPVAYASTQLAPAPVGPPVAPMPPAAPAISAHVPMHPHAAYPPPPMYAPPPPPRSGTSGAWLVVVGLSVVVLCGGIAGAMYMFMARDGRRDAREERREKREERQRETSDKEEPAPSASTGSVVPTEEKPTAEVRVRDCEGAALATQPKLRNNLTAIGWKPTGDLLFCAGDMVNFRCKGPGGNGVTATSPDGKEGSVVPIRFDSPDAIRSYVESEKQNSEDELTLAVGRRAVLRVDMPAAEADKLLDRLCR